MSSGTPGHGTAEPSAPGPSVVLAGGGTAGHVSPLLAIADAVREAAPDARITAVGTASGMETRLVPAAGYRLERIDRVPMPRRPNADLFRLPLRFTRAVKAAGRILDEAAADAVVGVGGYVCTPVYLAARRRGIPVVIHEANARAGLANRVGARFAARVATAFEGTGLPRAELVGMPMRAEIARLDRAAEAAEAREGFGLRPDVPTLVVTGGSSGAASINRTLQAVVPRLAGGGLQILHITGRGKQLAGDDGGALAAPGYHQVEYVDGMQSAYAAADLIVARSGAGTVCELAAVGLPSVLVPLPIGNGEQRLNAAPLERAGGAIVVDDAGFTPEWFLREVPALVADSARRESMAAAASALGRRDAAGAMARIVLEVIGARRPRVGS
ncbi:undecaprenyldiphospho-muramoylpentapeptide beta-N-acetylglucosaminyltransferase [Zafaria sp. Z1313]|uniref:undecaprenyldiphospho-muramoylpentapeptide beta-N-acetylglucosaminyltransferase n=1 Tax=unclassified Zafaria TaxID=2828765 RepID=UPI002E7622E8|nr:undecaprenyldiphospho-muramoylpentapeptide beta-N-acetylglucosaminyltransferase [Zafaria sp. J156]MEE1620288.1 undecaprenyldiphospho-muramoylpentapeptide beta-N-acetylglucosaminyltransferase [Zafaria sp. J156]